MNFVALFGMTWRSLAVSKGRGSAAQDISSPAPQEGHSSSYEEQSTATSPSLLIKRQWGEEAKGLFPLWAVLQNQIPLADTGVMLAARGA